MVGQSRRLREPLTRAQRRVMAAVASCLALGAVGLAAYSLLAGNPVASSRHGCVNLTVASSTGGAQIQKCGAAARRWCHTEAGHQGPVAQLAVPQCRLAGYLPRAGQLSKPGPGTSP